MNYLLALATVGFAISAFLSYNRAEKLESEVIETLTFDALEKRNRLKAVADLQQRIGESEAQCKAAEDALADMRAESVIVVDEAVLTARQAAAPWN